MGGLCTIGFAPLVLGGRWLPGLTVATDHPARACLGSQYAGWRIDRDGYFAMASGPGRALIRAEELYDDLDVDERASTAVLCLETRDEPPEGLTAYVAERAGVEPGALTLLYAPTASLAGGVSRVSKHRTAAFARSSQPRSSYSSSARISARAGPLPIAK